jgi:hypothetical protein
MSYSIYNKHAFSIHLSGELCETFWWVPRNGVPQVGQSPMAAQLEQRATRVKWLTLAKRLGEAADQHPPSNWVRRPTNPTKQPSEATDQLLLGNPARRPTNSHRITQWCSRLTPIEQLSEAANQLLLSIWVRRIYKGPHGRFVRLWILVLRLSIIYQEDAHVYLPSVKMRQTHGLCQPRWGTPPPNVVPAHATAPPRSQLKRDGACPCMTLDIPYTAIWDPPEPASGTESSRWDTMGQHTISCVHLRKHHKSISSEEPL